MPVLTRKQVDALVDALDHGISGDPAEFPPEQQEFLTVAKEVFLGVASSIRERPYLTHAEFAPVVTQQVDRVGLHYYIPDDEREKLTQTLGDFFNMVASNGMDLERN